jgi:hypothetical protein
MDLKAKYLLETCSDPIGFLNQLRQTTEPIGGGTVYSEDGELVEYDVAIEAVRKANNTLEIEEMEPVSEELENEAFDYAETCKYEGGDKLLCVEHFKAGAEWKKQQMMKEAVSATIESDLDPHGDDYGNQKIICGWGELEAKKFKNGSKVKLIIIKED